MTHRPFNDYTFEGQRRLGEAIAHFREAAKPNWRPVVKAGLSLLDIEREKGKWTLEMMAAIINREFGLSEASAVDRNALHRLENPPLKRAAPPPALLELIAGLQIIINPKNGKPYTDADLRNIAKELLDWRTGERTTPSYTSQG